MTQESLFAPEPPAPKMQVRHWGMPAWFPHKLSHRDDPQTSKDAAEKMVESGKITEQQKTALEAWIKFGPGTSRQIADRAGGGDRLYHLLSRRKGELADAGYLRLTENKFGRSEEFVATGKKWCQN